jgi:hypothetical protein
VTSAAGSATPRAATLLWVLGWGSFAVFLLTGLFMRLGFPGVAPPDLAHRVFFRTHHLYLLGASLVLIVVGRHVRTAGGGRPRLRLASTALLLASPPLLLLGFTREHLQPTLRGGATSLGWIALAIGVLLHLLATRTVPSSRA